MHFFTKAVMSISFCFLLSVVSKLIQSWPRSSSSCSPASLSVVPSILFMTAKIIFICSFSNQWWICQTCFPHCSPWITTSNPLLCFGLGCLRETCLGDKASEVLYLLHWILSCPLTNVMMTTISCLTFQGLYTPPPFLLDSTWSPSRLLGLTRTQLGVHWDWFTRQLLLIV